MKELKNLFKLIGLIMLAVFFYFVNSFIWYRKCRKWLHNAAVQFLGFAIFGVVAFTLVIWSYFTPIYPFGGIFRFAALLMYLVPMRYYLKLVFISEIEVFVVDELLVIWPVKMKVKEWTDRDYYFWFELDGEKYLGRHGCQDERTAYAGFGYRGEAEEFVRKKREEKPKDISVAA